MKIHDDILLQFLEKKLPPEQAEAISSQLAVDEGLRSRLSTLRSLRESLQAGRGGGFGPFFAAKVVNRLGSKEEQAFLFYDSLRWLFARGAVVGLLAVFALGIANLVDYGDLQITSSLIEQAFGLPQVDMENAMLLAVQP